jgi:GNAT superfamily N-acetyltransferase
MIFDDYILDDLDNELLMLENTKLSYLENLLDTLENTNGGSLSSKSHLKNALYDWRIEKQWDNDNAKVLNLGNKGFMFISYTKREPRHCTLRHFFVLEKYRGLSIGHDMLDLLHKEILDNKVRFLRFFANKPSIGFYERLGYEWHGLSKTGLPFTYWDCILEQLAPLPKSQKRYIV